MENTLFLLDKIQTIVAPDYPGHKNTLPAEHLCWYVTERCNYTCKFCYRYQEGSGILEIDQVYRIIDKLIKLGISKITFTGEPLLVRWIYDAIEYAHSKGMYTTLMTNGSLYNQEKDVFLINNLNRLSLPLDGSNEEMNQIMTRAPGHYRRVVELANHFIATNIDLKITTVVTSVNWHDLSAIARQVISFGAKEWKVYQFRPNRGSAIENEGFFRIDDDKFLKAIAAASRIVRNSNVTFSYISLRDRFKDFFLVRPNGEIELATGSGYTKIGDLKEDTPEQLMTAYYMGVTLEEKS